MFIPKRKRKRRTPPRPRAPQLTVEQILAWADEWFARTGAWPKVLSGAIPGSLGENWRKVHTALYLGHRGLPGRSSLARLLHDKRGVRNEHDLPPLREEQILAWADAHFARTGNWPQVRSGAILDAPGETWLAVEGALRNGARGWPGGYSLVQLLQDKRGVRNSRRLSAITREEILRWADAHHQATGAWPHIDSGPIDLAEGETWLAVDDALRQGRRGLPGGSSLARLLASERGVRNPGQLPPLTKEQILGWAQRHRQRTGAWPTRSSGPILDADFPGETWARVSAALTEGLRGLPCGSSLSQLLCEHRNEKPRRRMRGDTL